MTHTLKLFNAKKGQFYILIALLLISYAFTLTRLDTPIRKPKDTFQLLHEGYMSEGAAAVNNAVYEGANVTARLANFTSSYVRFARSSEPGFRMAYLLRHKGLLTIGNRLGMELNATVGTASYLINPDGELTVAASNASLKINRTSYAFQFSGEELQLKAVFRTSDRLTTRVFVTG